MAKLTSSVYNETDQYYANCVTSGYIRRLLKQKQQGIPPELQMIVTLYADLHFILLRCNISENASSRNELCALSGDKMRSCALRWLCGYVSGDGSKVSVRLWFRFPVLKVLYSHNWLRTPSNVCCSVYIR